MHNLQDNFKIVFRGRFIWFQMAAFLAFMDNDTLSFAEFYCDRLHQAAASGCPVAGVYIHMLAVQTVRTVVGVTIPLDFPAAVLANKIFGFANEFGGHQHPPFMIFSAAVSISSGAIQFIAGSFALNQFA